MPFSLKDSAQTSKNGVGGGGGEMKRKKLEDSVECSVQYG